MWADLTYLIHWIAVKGDFLSFVFLIYCFWIFLKSLVNVVIYFNWSIPVLYGGGLDCEIKTNQCFETYSEVMKIVNQFCCKNYHPIRIHRSKIFQPDNPDYYYLSVTYTCVHSGKYKARGKGIRPIQYSLCNDCPFKIKVRLMRKPHLHYKITQVVLQHNHKIGPMDYSLYPKQRLLTAEEKCSVKDMIKCNVSTKDLKNYIQNNTGKIITSSDVNNLRQNLTGTLNSHMKNSDILIEQLNNLIKDDKNCNIHLETDENHVFRFLLIQTKVMRLLAEQFPSVLFFDATYKVNIEGFPLYSILCEDGHGRGRPICYIFVLNEKRSTVKPAIQKFIDLNPSILQSCKIIVTDKDLKEMHIIKELFPNVINILCIFHVLKYLRLKISSLDINKLLKETIIRIVKQIVYSNTEKQYYQNLETLKMSCPLNFYHYFITNWDSCKEKFVLAYTKHYEHLGNRTNNRIESHNQKIKPYLKPEMHLCVAIREILKYIKNVSNSIIHSSFKEMKVMSSQNSSELNSKIGSICTHKSYELICSEIQKFKDGTYLIEQNEDKSYHVFHKTQGYLINECINSCSCSYNKQFLLPCEHLFAARCGLGQQLFSEDMVDKRWRKDNCLGYTQAPSFPAQVTKQTVASPGVPLTGQQKFAYARIHTDKLATMLSQCGTQEYERKLKMLSELTRAWECDEKIVICKESSGNLYKYVSDLNFQSNNTEFNGNLKAEQVSTSKVQNPCYLLPTSKSNLDADCASCQNVDYFSKREIIIPSVKHRRGRAKNAFSSFNVPTKHTKSNLQVNKSLFNQFVKLANFNNNNVEVNQYNYKHNLNNNDIKDIVSQHMLNDNVINAGQNLIKMRFPKTNGLQDVLLGSMLRFQIVKSEFVQVLHCGRFPHWISVSTLGAPPATVHVYNSLNQAVPDDIIPQICNIMNVQSSHFSIISKSMQIQGNGVDCGLFALASIVTLLNGEDPSLTSYDTSCMRTHFLSSLEKGYLQDFPTLNDVNTSRSLERLQRFELPLLTTQNNKYNLKT